MIDSSTLISNAIIDGLYISDYNSDSINDLKIYFSYMTNGLGLSTRVIYLLQNKNYMFTKIAYDDLIAENKIERDMDADGKYEIITKSLVTYKNHSYWVYNIFNISNYGLTNANKVFDYPIMIRFLHKKNNQISRRIPRKSIKSFSQIFPAAYSINK